MDLETFYQFLAGIAGAAFYLLVKYVIKKAKNVGHYTLACKYPGCDFRVAVSDEKYSYICDDLMADHQNRFHPLEFKETY